MRVTLQSSRSIGEICYACTSGNVAQKLEVHSIAFELLSLDDGPDQYICLLCCFEPDENIPAKNLRDYLEAELFDTAEQAFLNSLKKV